MRHPAAAESKRRPTVAQALRLGGNGRRRWVHLGLSPDAIWLTKSGDWRVAGFGLAQSVEDGRFDALSPFFDHSGAESDSIAVRDGAELALLTAGPRLAYSAPELTAEVRGPRRVSPAADVFSLAAVLYEALGASEQGDFAPLLDGCESYSGT